MNNIEIELRYEILDKNNLSQFLDSLKFISTKHIVDIYLDTPSGDLLAKGIFIRIRNEKKLDIKFNRDCLINPELAHQDYCEEYSFELPLQESDLVKLNEVCAVFGFEALHQADLALFKHKHHLVDAYFLDKKRITYSKDEFVILVDEIVGLGVFLEIEIMAQNTHNIKTIKQHMENLLVDLFLKPLHTGYVTLMVRKYNFEHYLRSRFILEEDKKYRTKDV